MQELAHDLIKSQSVTSRQFAYSTLANYAKHIGNETKAYDIEIINVLYASSTNKNMVIKVTDDDLLQKTGGIVQGMSGSPIVQNGMLVGAVTHVFVNDPQQGYAIFAETMIETAEELEQKLADNAA